MKNALLGLVLLLAGSCFAQTTTPPTPPAPTTNGPFAVTAGVVTASVKGQSIVGTSLLGLLSVTPNFRIRDDNTLFSSKNAQQFLGGGEYSWLHLIKSSTLNKSIWDSYMYGEVGADRYTNSASVTTQHIGLEFGGGLRMDPTKTGNFSLTLIEVGLARLPSLSGGMVPVVRSSINWNFSSN
jgi:hypothetical protein